jgi:multisubunit Na+/H+ antiporter MnhG subunit
MERTKLESAAANYSYLRGLMLIPAGLLFLIAALSNWEWGPFAEGWVFFAAVALAGGIGLLLSRYYNEHYGRLHPSTRQQVRGAAGVAIGVAVVVGGSTLLRSNASWSLDLPVNATAITLALVMLVYYAIGIGLKAHHVLIWGALLVAGALPVWNGADPSNIGLVMAGVAIMVSGVFDHRLFVETFGSPGLPSLENGDVGA